MTSPYPTTNSPAGLSPGLAPTTPGTPISAHGLRATTSTRSHLNPLSTRLASTSRAGSVLGGSVAATSVHLHQANPEDFEKALDEFVERQLPELERLLGEVVGGIDGAFDQASSSVTERKFQQLQATLQHLITSTRQTGFAGIPISAPPGTNQTATLNQIANEVERATESCYVQRQTVRDGARAVCEIMRGAGK